MNDNEYFKTATEVGRKGGVGRRVRAYRLSKDLTLCQLASLIGISKTALHRTESGGKPAARTSFKIDRFLQAVKRAA